MADSALAALVTLRRHQHKIADVTTRAALEDFQLRRRAWRQHKASLNRFRRRRERQEKKLLQALQARPVGRRELAEFNQVRAMLQQMEKALAEREHEASVVLSKARAYYARCRGQLSAASKALEKLTLVLAEQELALAREAERRDESAREEDYESWRQTAARLAS